MKTYFKEFDFSTGQTNLHELEPKLVDHIEEHDYFHVIDLTDQSKDWVKDSGVVNGTLTVQAMHTTCVISINELDEPCLLGDINKQLRDSVPKTKSYLHNGPLRYKNLCEEDTKCDRNADAHIKSFMFGAPAQTIIVRDGKPLWGQWQRLCLIDFDGPRSRKLSVQIMGE